MKAFEYAAPESEQEVLELLCAQRGETELMAGGTDLVGLMKKMIVTPERVVSLSRVASLKAIDADSQGARLGAMATLEDVAEHPVSADYPALRQAIAAIHSLQLQAQGTLGGELCQRPRCWYFRGGDGLLASGGRLVAEGDSRYHAIFGNTGAAKFVSPSRLAPALIALGAKVRIVGPGPEDETEMPLEFLFRTPKDERQREHDLEPNQFVSHILLPPAGPRIERVVRSAARSRARVSAGRGGRGAGDSRRHRGRRAGRAGPGGAGAVAVGRSERSDRRPAGQRSHRRSGRRSRRGAWPRRWRRTSTRCSWRRSR